MTSLPIRRAIVATLGLAATSPLAAQDYRPAPFLGTNDIVQFPGMRADLNGNGLDDLIVSRFGGFGQGLYTITDPGLANPSATLNNEFLATAVVLFGGIVVPRGLLDMNNDGNDDILMEVSALVGSGSGAYYLPGDGAGNFGSHVLCGAAPGKTAAVFGDFDGNGENDVAVFTGVPFAPPEVTLFLQSGGTFQPSANILPFGFRLEAGDFNGDGFDDIASMEAGTLSIQLGGDPLPAPQTFVVNSSLLSMTVCDLDEDGFDDIITWNGAQTPSFAEVLFGDATTVLESPVDLVPGGINDDNDGLLVDDVDGDGREEVVFQLRNSPGYGLLRHDGSRNFSPAVLMTTDMRGDLLDLDGDGDLDLLAFDAANTGYTRQENLANFGEACSGAAGAPRLLVADPIPGTANFTIGLENAAPNVAGFLFFSTAATPGPCGPQLDAPTLVPGLLMITDALGNASYPVPLPASTDRGPYFLQGLVLDPSGTFTQLGNNVALTGGRTVSVY